jgi:MoaA/NifB/PqqE/SkfB family radical SAM enzyme
MKTYNDSYMRDRYKLFIECNVPGSACNLKCSYCYVAQMDSLTNRTIIKYNYPPDIVGKALSKKRIGGCAYINVCGAGETLLSQKLPEYIREMLLQGHYVNVYTNGTVNSTFKFFNDFSDELLQRLSFSFSLHWLELIKNNLLQKFFNNFNKMKALGCSVVCNMVLDDSYLPHIEAIKESCLLNIGAYPQISFPKKENQKNNYTELCHNREITEKIGDSFNSPYFSFTKKYFNYDRKYFCYAGAWSFTLNLENGNIAKCYHHAIKQNIFKNPDRKIKFEAVGNRCRSKCCGGGLLLPQGLVPELNVCSYIELKDRPEANWYTRRYKDFLSQQLVVNNKEYTLLQKKIVNIVHPISNIYYWLNYCFRNVKNYINRIFPRAGQRSTDA